MKQSRAFRPHAAMVLAAGMGRRMRPLTEARPKPLVEIGGRALIDRVLDALAGAGVEMAVVNIHHHADMLEAHLARRMRPRIVISDERDQLLDTGGGIARALAHLGPDPFYVANADSVWIEGGRPLLDGLAAAWEGTRMDALLALARGDTAIGYEGKGDFDADEAARLSRRAAQGCAAFVYTGTVLLSPRLFSGAPETPFSLNLLFDRAIAAGRLFGHRLEGRWLHVGTPEAVAAAERALAASVA